MSPADAAGGDEGRPPRLLVSVAELRRHPGARQDLRREMPAHGLALSDVVVPEGAEVSFAGEVEAIVEGVVAVGTVSVPWEAPCRRCLRPVSGVATVDVREIFESRPVEGETWPLEHDQIDLGPLLHDTALLALPLAPLCDEGCLGPAPDEFPAVVEGDAPEATDGEPADEPPRDPRWAALDDLDL